MAPEASPPGTLLLFWDYDTQWGADRSRAPGGPKSWGPLEFENTERLLALHAEFSIPACFAVVGAAALAGARPYHDPDQVRRIHAAGHEVGSHSFRHEWLPGLNRGQVMETLKSSREALEQCIGAPVTAFVPPYNQPFDHPPRLSWSVSERRTGSAERMSLSGVCAALAETGYRFCRVAFRSLSERLVEKLSGRRVDRPERIERLSGIDVARLNTPGGFDAPATAMLDRCAREGGIAVVYGHPHSLSSDNSQSERHFRPFLEKAAALRDRGRLSIRTPRDLATPPGRA